jgi:hypothetical protein
MKYVYCLLILIIAVLPCCKKVTTTAQIFTEASYPLTVGNWWQYQIDETNEGGGYDTLTLSIISMSTIGPYTNYKCYYLYQGAVTDSAYFLQSDTSLSFVNLFPYPYFGCFPNFHFRFPIEKGQYWQGAFSGDSTLVVGVANSCEGTYGTSYGPCFSTVESYNLPHNFMVNDMLLTPKVGLVRQSINYKSDTAVRFGFAGIQINQSVNLISYHVQ